MDAVMAEPSGHRATASLTYHGGFAAHREKVLPFLDELGLCASFYPAPTALFDDPRRWQAAAARGHEIGNSAFYGVSLDGALDNWTLEMVSAELGETESLLLELFAERDHSFAYPGRSSTCVNNADDREPVSYEAAVREVFEVAVAHVEGVNRWNDLDLSLLRTVPLNDSDETLRVAEEALSLGHWVIFRAEDLRVESDLVNSRLCRWLVENSERIVTEPVITAAKRVLAQPGSKR
jgi:peptidoglycan/xylan/chitin deacetylase (PgdA/CDA1 family)